MKVKKSKRTKKATTKSARDADPVDSSKRVALRAYHLYLARGARDGGALDDWLTAQAEISAERSPRSTALTIDERL